MKIRIDGPLFRSPEDKKWDYLLGYAEFDFSNPNVCHGKSGSGSSGGGTTTSNQTVSPPPQVLAAYQQALAAASSAASTPLQEYSGQQVAGFTPDQLAAFQTVGNTSTAYQPYLSNASTDIQNSTTPLWSGVPQFSAANVNQYESPYTQNVVNATQAEFNNQNAQQQQQVAGNAISSGAWGGDRSAVAQALTAGQEQLAESPTIAGLENSGYNTALGEFNNQQSTQLSANEANAYLNSQAGFGNINLANSATGLPLEQASAQSAAGSQQQALAQEELNVPYEQYLQEQAYPFQTAQYYADIAEGLGNQGSSGTSSTTEPAASTTSQVAGGLLGFGSLLGASGAFGSSGWLASGGRIKRDFGGGIPSIPNFAIDFIPATDSSGGKSASLQLPQAPRTESSSGNSQSTLSGISGLANLAKVLGGALNGSSSSGGTAFSSGIDPSTGNNNATQNSIDNSFLSNGNVSSDTTDPSDMSFSGNSIDTSSLGSQDWGGFLDSMGSSDLSFQHGGSIGKKYAVGGEVLPDVVSGIGDIVGAFFGDPAAGDQGVGILSNADGGATKGAGVETQVFGMAEGKGHDEVEDQSTGTPGQGLNSLFDFNTDNNPITANTSGSGATQQQQEGLGMMPGLMGQAGNGAGLASMFMNKGGRAKYDDGGGISAVTGAQPTAYDSTQIQQNAYQQISQMPLDKLQQLQVRLPPNTPQGQLVQKAIKQKQFMPNQPTSGFTAPTAPTSPAMAAGGRMGFDDGGDTSDADTSPPVPQYSGNDTQSTNIPQARQVAKVDPWESLAAAGFGMMAGTSPQAAVNIGKGALTGLQDYASQKKEVAQQNYQQSQLDQAAQRMADEADYRNKSLAQSQNEFDTKQNTVSATEQAELAQRLKEKQIELNTMTPFQKAEIQNMQAERQKPIPDGMGGFIVPNPQDPNNPKHISAPGMSAPALDASGQPLTGDAYLATLPPDRAAEIKALDEGRMNYPSGFALKTPYFQQMLNQLYQYNPDASAQTAASLKAFNTGKQGDTVRSLNVATSHLDTIDQLNNALNNGDVRALNTVGNAIKTQFGDAAQPNFDFAKQIVGDEVVKGVLGSGAGSAGDREKLQKDFDDASSPAQLQGVVATAKTLMRGQIGGLRQQYQVSTGRKDFDRMLTPEAQKALAGPQTPSTDVQGQSPSIPKPLAGMSGLQFSPTRQQYRDASGNIYDVSGNKVQ